jgi:hypothetical protein
MSPYFEFWMITSGIAEPFQMKEWLGITLKGNIFNLREPGKMFLETRTNFFWPPHEANYRVKHFKAVPVLTFPEIFRKHHTLAEKPHYKVSLKGRFNLRPSLYTCTTIIIILVCNKKLTLYKHQVSQFQLLPRVTQIRNRMREQLAYQMYIHDIMQLLV